MSGELERTYEAAGFGRSLAWGRHPALIVVDFARAYLEPSSPLYAGVEDALAATERVLAAARRAGIPVVFTTVCFQPGGVDGGVFYRKVAALKVFEEDSPLAELPPSLARRPGELLIKKQYPSAFFGTSLAPTLHAAHIDTVLVTGLTTSGCVRASVVDAMSHGFVPVVVADAVGDRDPRPHEANLFDMAAKYADVVDEADAIGWLDGLGRSETQRSD